MIRPKKNTLFCMITLCVFSLAIAPTVYAGSFKRTTTMDLTYAWGSTSFVEFDAYETMYPGTLPVAEITFETDGTFFAYDTATGESGYGVYDKRGRNLEITVVNLQTNLVIEYIGRKESRGVFSGEIVVNGSVAGHWRGRL